MRRLLSITLYLLSSTCSLFGFNSWVWVDDFPWVYVHETKSWVFFHPNCDIYTFKGRDWDISYFHKSWEKQNPDYLKSAGWVWTGQWPASPYVYLNRDKKWAYLQPTDGESLYFYSTIDNSWTDLTFGGFLSLSPLNNWEKQYQVYLKNPNKYGGLKFLEQIDMAITNQAYSLSFDYNYKTYEELNLEPIVWAENIQSFSLRTDTEKVVSLAPLNFLKDLNELRIKAPNLDVSLYDELKLENLRYLSIHHSKLENLNFFKNLDLNNLEDLSVMYCNQLVDISEVSKISSLKGLTLYEIGVSDFSALSQMSHLGWFDLSNNNIKNIDFVEGMSALEEIILHNNLITDLSPLSGLEKLEWIEIVKNKVTNLRPLTNLKKLSFLKAFDNPIDMSSRVDFIKSTENQDIKIYWPTGEPSDELLTDELFSAWVESPDKYGGLEVLEEIRNAKISQTSELAIGNYYHSVRDLSPFSILNKLTFLWIDGSFDDLSPLSNLANLEVLILNSYYLSDLSPLSDLANLEVLKLNSYDLSDLSPLSTLQKLQTLSVYGAYNLDLYGLEALTALKNLYLANNGISNIENLINLSNLTHLDLQDNDLSDEDLLYLGELQNLESLKLTGNTFLNTSKTILELTLPNTVIEW